MRICLTVNRQKHTLSVTPEETLLDVIRDRLGLKGTKRGCDSGQCGACTVLMDGKTIYSCILPAVEADGAVIETIEGIGEPHNLHPLQTAFIEKGAVQCGFCTPGMILASKVLLDHNESPSRSEIRRALSGNLCRCTGYKKIVDAVAAAAEVMRTTQKEIVS
ncbi:MAG: (2Fe-2S)-binding protein [Synergistaceae bacterium]|jgi:carbon-monoxide dehydrogenase small subunit|nr:(2Fe-2S)-binding protein [Synergistaceae bacterium]